MLDDLVEVEVKEKLPLDDWTADGTTKIVIAKVCLLRWAAKVVAIRVHGIVLKILIRRTVEAVCPPFADLIVENAADAILR